MRRYFNRKESVVRLILALLLLLVTIPSFAEPCTFDGASESDFHGYQQFDFTLEGRACKVACPKEVAPGRPWVWRALFWGHEPQADVALLGKGFHVAYIDVFEFHGNDTAVKIFDNLYAFLTGQHGFGKRPALEGLSRGGLIAYNWASEHPDQVSCIYGDAPVCDIRSWPGGLGAGQGSPEDWKVCLAAWGLDESSAKDFKRNPIDRLASLAKAGIPLLHVVGDADDVVPVAENTDVLAERYRALGGAIEIINKPGVGHHPHSLVDPAPIVDFIVKHAATEK